MENRCQFIYADGRRCAQQCQQDHRTLCSTHADREAKRLAPSEIAKQLATLSGEFKTASDVNHALGKVWTLLAESRIQRRDAITFAYIAQLMLQSLPSVESEIKVHRGYKAWGAAVNSALPPDARE
jgi:hypothetical protein